MMKKKEMTFRQGVQVNKTEVHKRMKGICHSLFVITRTQLNLNKIVISKQS